MCFNNSFVTNPKLLLDNAFIQIWCCYYDTGLYSSGSEIILGVELPYDLSLALDKRKSEYVAGRFCAKKALSARGITVAPGYNSNRSPAWPKGIQGSISHSHGVAVAATSHEYFIGIDLEAVIGEKELDSVANVLLTDSEKKKFYNVLNPIDITIIFSLKESFYKAVYPFVGCLIDFSAISVTRIDSKQKKIFYKLERSFSPQLSVGLELDADWFELANRQYLTWVKLEKE